MSIFFFIIYFNFDFLINSKPKPHPFLPMAQKICFLTEFTVQILSKLVTSFSVFEFFWGRPRTYYVEKKIENSEGHG